MYCDIQQLDGAQAVKTKQLAEQQLLYAWFGSHTVNVYAIRVDGLYEVECFTWFGERGEKPSRSKVLELIEDHFDNEVDVGCDR